MARRGMKFGIFLAPFHRSVPDEYRYRTVGAQDVDPAAEG